MIILHNGIIHTLNALQPVVEALAIQGKHIRAAGKSEDILELADRNTQTIDLHGQAVLPGLTDAHIHILQYGMKLTHIDCETDCKATCLQRVAAAAASTPAGKWIIGQGWNHNEWESGLGSKKDLDTINTPHPIFLAAKSLHASWVNSTALQIAGIDRNTPDPPGGSIQRDQHGEPTGILFESATQLVEEKIPAPSDEQIKAILLEGQHRLLQYGITSIHDVDEWRIYPLLQELCLNKELFLRVIKSIPLDNLQRAIDQHLSSGVGDDNVKIGWLKLFMDGALGPQTAAMFSPYLGSDNNYGTLMLSKEELYQIGKIATENGISLEVHAIGDRAIHEALNGIQDLSNLESTQKLYYPHRIEHAQIIQVEDIQRMAALQVTASMQPIHVLSDMETAEKYWGNRCEGAYAWNSIQKAGISLVFGSDAPVESPNPFLGIHAAVTRRKSLYHEAWYPQQAITLRNALIAYCGNPAILSRNQQSLGQLAPGYLADLIILPLDPFSSPSEDLKKISPIATIIGGEFVWQHSDFSR